MKTMKRILFNMNGTMSKSSKAFAAATLSLLISSSIQAEPLRLQKTVDNFFYELHGGTTIPRSASGYVTYRIGARIRFTSGYSCGRFDTFDNIEQAVNRIRDQIEALPDQLSMAATSAISALPLYLVKTYEPNIYGLLVWNMDQAIELFRFEYKTCEQLESEIKRNDAPGFNPYKTAVRAAVFNQYVYGADEGESLTQTANEAKQNPGRRGITHLGQAGRGRDGDPIRLKRELAIVGYNNTLGRTDNPRATTAVEGAEDEYLVQVWPTPTAAADWIVMTTGDVELVVEGSGTNGRSTTPGIGLRPEVNKITRDYREAITRAVSSADYSALEELENTMPEQYQLSPKLVEDLRSLKPNKRSLAIQKLASNAAVGFVSQKANLAIEILEAGMEDPDTYSSDISSETKTFAAEAINKYERGMASLERQLHFNSITGYTPIQISKEAYHDRTQDTGTSTPSSTPAVIRDQNGLPVDNRP